MWDGVSAGGEGGVAPVLYGVECGGAELRRAADDVGVGDGAVAIDGGTDADLALNVCGGCVERIGGRGAVENVGGHDAFYAGTHDAFGCGRGGCVVCAGWWRDVGDGDGGFVSLCVGAGGAALEDGVFFAVGVDAVLVDVGGYCARTDAFIEGVCGKRCGDGWDGGTFDDGRGAGRCVCAGCG